MLLFFSLETWNEIKYWESFCLSSYGLVVIFMLVSSFVLKLLTLLSRSVILQWQWDSGCANQPSLVTHTVQTMWWITIDAGLHDWIVWTNVSQGDRVLTVCPWEVSACNVSQDQSLLHKCAWTDGDLKTRSHWNLSSTSDKITYVTWGPT